MSFIAGFIIGGIYFWILGRAVMFNQVQNEIKNTLISGLYAAPETFGLREYLRRWYCKHKFF